MGFHDILLPSIMFYGALQHYTTSQNILSYSMTSYLGFEVQLEARCSTCEGQEMFEEGWESSLLLW